MANLKFEVWCRKAVSRIALPKDRVTAGRELMQHMEDRLEACLGQGMPREEAEQQTIEAMGDPDALSRQLADLYQPYWYLRKLWTRRVLAVMLCITAFFVVFYVLTNEILYLGYARPVYYRYDPYEDTSVSDSIGKLQRVYYDEPNVRVSTDGYSLKLTRAALWHDTYTDTNGQQQEDDYFHFRIEIANIRPWAAYDDTFRWFWAEDSLGNHYYAAYERSGSGEPSVQGAEYQMTAMSRIWDMYLTDYISQEAEWLELHYDRAGRDLTLRIDLTGEGKT